MSIEKGVTKCGKITEMFLSKVSVSGYRSKNAVILCSLAITVGENAAILGQPDTFEMKYIEFLY